MEGNIDEIVALFTSGIDINTMLEVSNYTSIYDNLVNKIILCPSQGEATPLMIAAFKGLMEVLEVLLIYGAAINIQNKVRSWHGIIYSFRSMLLCNIISGRLDSTDASM